MAVARFNIVRAVAIRAIPMRRAKVLRIRNVPWTLQTNGFSFCQGGEGGCCCIALPPQLCHGCFVSSYNLMLTILSSNRLGNFNRSNKETRRQLSLTDSIKLEKLLRDPRHPSSDPDAKRAHLEKLPRPLPRASGPSHDSFLLLCQ